MKPIFKGEFNSFGDFDQEALKRILSGSRATAPTLVEVGSWLGTGSTRLLIEHAKQTSGTLHCVDTWQGSPGVDRHLKLVQNYDIFETFKENVRLAGGEDLVVAHRLTSLEAAAGFADASIDIVFIDADHKYASVVADIRTWLPKVKPGGLLIGHDCEARPTEATRPRLMTALDRDHIDGEPPFAAWHAGVIIGVDEIFGDKARRWSEAEITLADGRPGRSTLWEVVR